MAAAPGRPSASVAHVPAVSDGDVRFGIDAASFATEAGRTRQEIFLQIANPELTFKENGTGHLARIEAEFRFIDPESGDEVAGKTMTAELPALTQAETRDRAQVHILQSEFDLDPGRYQLDVKLKDLNKKRTVVPLLVFWRRPVSGKVSLELSVPEFDLSRFAASDLEFAREIAREDIEESPFRKGNLSVVPCPERVYGLLLPHLNIYLELYDQPVSEEGELLQVDTALKDHVGTTVLTRQETVMLSTGERWARTIDFDLSEIPSGQYAIEVEMRKQSGERISRHGTFDVVWSLFSWSQDFDDLVEDMVPIATSAQLSRLKSLSSGERELFLEDFWRSLDPTPDTPRNEALEEHYERIRIADRVFTTRTRGSRTDRGKIFVKYGQPDEVQTGFATDEFLGNLPFLARNQFDFSQEGRAKGGVLYQDKAYETWLYDQSGRQLGHRRKGSIGLGLKYVFVDLSGYGDYRMIYSSDNVE